MNENNDQKKENFDGQEEPARDLLPDRDVLMMEKTVSDNRAAGFRPADKKLLRRILVILGFLIAALIVLMVFVRRDGTTSTPGAPGAETETVIRSGGE